MKKRAILCLAASFAVLATTLAQDVKYERIVLANGMTVILHEDHSLPVAAVNLWYHVGSKDEPPHRSGFAHLFEHLMFMGTRRAPRSEFDKIMEGGGGNNNASTTQDRTNFYDYGPSNLLPTLLWLEADRLEDLGRMMDQHKLNLQRQVVENERRQNYENAPYGMVPLKVDEAMYPENHPYHIDTIGLTSDIDSATVRDVKDFFAAYYVPNNATMVVAGDFDPEKIKPLLNKLFGTLPRGNDPIHKAAPVPVLQGTKRLTMVDKVTVPRAVMAWHSPPAYQPGDAEMELIAGILTDGFASRLYQRLVVKDQLASDVSADQGSQLLGSLFTISATANPDVPIERVEAAIDDELSKLVKSGPTADELARVKAKYQTGTLFGLQSLSDVADRMNQYEFYLGEPNSFKWDIARHTQADPADAQAWAQKVLDLNSRLILRILPESKAPPQNPRDQRPPATPTKPFNLPRPSLFRLANGIRVFYFSRPDLPLMAVSTLFNAGSASDPVSKSGLAQLTANMLDQGAADLDAEGFSKALDALGASVIASSSSLTSVVTLYSNATAFDKALPLYANAIIRPHLDPKDFEREQSIQLNDLTQEAQDPDAVASFVAMREYFGPSHPYGRDPAGTQTSVSSLTVDDVKREHAAFCRPDMAAIFVAGSLPQSEVQTDLEREFGNWKAQAGSTPATQPKMLAPTHEGLHVFIVDKPNAVQTIIRFVFPGEPYKSRDRLALHAISALFGGTFTSRLNSDLREAKGYTYGADAHFVFQPSLGYMVAESAVRSDVTGASLQEFFKEFAELRTGDIKETEAMTARASIKTDAINGFESISGLISTAEYLYENGRSMDDMSRELNSLAGLSASALNPLTKQLVPLDRAVLVMVGDKNAILKQTASLKLPKAKIVTWP